MRVLVRNSSTNNRRHGRATPLLLICLFVMLPMGALAIETARMRLARLELQSTVDACSLGAVQELIDDRRLADEEAVRPELLKRTRETSVRFAELNPVGSRPIQTTGKTGGEPAFEVLTGTYSRADRRFVATTTARSRSNPETRTLNAVRVIARQSMRRGKGNQATASMLTFDVFNVAAQSTAALDHRVIGFRPTGAQTVPVIPIAIRSGRPETDTWCWQSQRGGRRCESVDYPVHVGGVDRVAWDAAKKTFSSGSDGIPEVLVEFERNAALLLCRADSVDQVLVQIAGGLSPEDLSVDGGALQVGQQLPALMMTGEAGRAVSSRLVGPLNAVRDLREPRIWPLFKQTGGRRGEVRIVDFVAARIVTVIQGGKQSPVSVLLQPCMMCEPTALVDSDGTPSLMKDLAFNPYICKVRLVD